MSPEADLVAKLTTLNRIAETLNRSVDVHGMLQDALSDLVHLMDLQTGWVFLKDGFAEDRHGDGGFVLAAHHQLPPALDPRGAGVWGPGCACQARCGEACGREAYNVMHCSRLESAQGDRQGLAVHASAPLRSGDRDLGILNVAGPDWASFNPQSLALLANVGSQMGVALERARLFDLLREQRTQEQEVLLHFSSQLLGRLDLADLIHYLVDQVRGVLRSDACALLLPAEEAGWLDFRAAVGWRADPAAAHRRAQTGEKSGLGRAMVTRQPVQVRDLEGEADLEEMPGWLRAEGFRGHSVVPLLVEGRSIGTLSVDDRRPRVLDDGELRLLRLMANQAAIAIEKARLHEEEVNAQALAKELEVGQKIQLSLLPEGTPAVPGWEFAVHYQAARLVGGDFYDLFDLPGDPDRLGLVIADVVGKGVPAALLMAVGRTVIRAAALQGANPASLLRQANRIVARDSHSELFLTAFYAALDTVTGRLVYANAGHNRPLWLQAATGEVQELDAQGTLLGAFDEIELEERSLDLAPGDLLALYTDGVSEAMDAGDRLFGTDRLHSILRDCAGAGPQEVLDTIVRAVHTFTGDAPLSDDLTLLILRRLR